MPQVSRNNLIAYISQVYQLIKGQSHILSVILYQNQFGNQVDAANALEIEIRLFDNNLLPTPSLVLTKSANEISFGTTTSSTQGQVTFTVDQATIDSLADGSMYVEIEYSNQNNTVVLPKLRVAELTAAGGTTNNGTVTGNVFTIPAPLYRVQSFDYASNDLPSAGKAVLNSSNPASVTKIIFNNTDEREKRNAYLENFLVNRFTSGSNDVLLAITDISDTSIYHLYKLVSWSRVDVNGDGTTTQIGDGIELTLQHESSSVSATQTFPFLVDQRIGILLDATGGSSTSGGSSSLTVSDDSLTVNNVDTIDFGTSATVTDNGNGNISVSIAPGINGTSGTSGVNGNDGADGTSGTSGVNGNDGTSGTSGVNGNDGADGTSGTSGVNGNDGTSGTSGVNGNDGADGTSGTSGVNGNDGADGTSGTSGVNGADGTSGTSGVNGADGTSGTSGVNGNDGADGTSGTSGVNGADGTSGTSGVNGNDGADGTSGTSGVNGNDGADGTSGTSGVNGNDGADGTSGTSGVNGADGTSGTSGVNGNDGADGTSGTSGVNGNDGADGTSGTSGVNGNDGADGTSGTSGVNGNDGADGTSGTSGVNGNDGADGTSGTSGVNGNDGADGTSGTSGVNGADGTSGTSGVNGNDGASKYLLRIEYDVNGTLINNSGSFVTSGGFLANANIASYTVGPSGGSGHFVDLQFLDEGNPPLAVVAYGWDPSTAKYKVTHFDNDDTSQILYNTSISDFVHQSTNEGGSGSTGQWASANESSLFTGDFGNYQITVPVEKAIIKYGNAVLGSFGSPSKFPHAYILFIF